MINFIKMYFWNYIEESIWNNKLSFEERKKQGSDCILYVPDVLDIWEITKEKLNKFLKLSDKIVFEEFENWKLYSKTWLDKYLVWKIWNSQICIFDNHNLAFYFIWKYFLETWNKLNLIHIDQHSDMYEPYFYPKKLENIEDIEKYTFEWVNVGNYLLPLQKLWFVKEIYQKRTEISVLELEDNLAENSILNIDLDFWEVNMATTDKSLQKLKKYIWKSPLILLASSPYFIEQEKALKLIYKLFN